MKGVADAGGALKMETGFAVVSERDDVVFKPEVFANMDFPVVGPKSLIFPSLSLCRKAPNIDWEASLSFDPLDLPSSTLA